MAWYDAPRYISEGISQGIIDKFNQAKLGQILDEMQQTKQLRTTLGNLPQDITPEQRMTTIGEALMRTGQYPQGAAILDTLYRTNAISQINQQRMTRQEAQKAINEATGYIRTGNLAGFKAMLDNPSIQDNPLIKNRYGDISDSQVQSKLISAYFNENNPAWKRTQQINKTTAQKNLEQENKELEAEGKSPITMKEFIDTQGQGKRTVSLYDKLESQKTGKPVYKTLSQYEVNKDKDRYMAASVAQRDLPKATLIRDIERAIKNVEDSLDDKNLKLGGIVLPTALNNLGSKNTFSTMVGRTALSNLDKTQQKYIANVLNLREQILALRNVLGTGQSATDVREAMLATAPSGATPSAEFGLNQLKLARQQLNVLRSGIADFTYHGEDILSKPELEFTTTETTKQRPPLESFESK